MTRSDDDSWDVATSVGATASMVAAARAVASRKPDPLISDPYAEVLVRAVGIELFARLASGALEFEDVGPGWLPDLFAVRARFFDDFVSAVLSEGMRQVVIVASGLDARAYRLRWPVGTVVYEIDQPAVIEFKTVTLTNAGVTPAVELHTVGVDLRSDWPAALQGAGFDPARPTAWIAEGLIIGFLAPEAQERLLAEINALSAPGSRLVADYLPPDAPSLGSLMGGVEREWRENGFEVNFGSLFYPNDRSDAEQSFSRHGWLVNRYTITDLLAAAELTTHSLDTSPNHLGGIHYLDAIKR